MDFKKLALNIEAATRQDFSEMVNAYTKEYVNWIRSM